jgi:hypothetical protein
MKLWTLCPWSVQFSFGVFIRLMKEPNTIIIKGKFCEILVLMCGLQHFKQSSRIIFEILILNFSIVKIKLFIDQWTVLFDNFPLPIFQILNSLILLLYLFLQIPNSILISWVGYPQKRQLIISLFNNSFEIVVLGNMVYARLTIRVQKHSLVSHCVFLVFIIRCEWFLWPSNHLNNFCAIGLWISLHISMRNDCFFFISWIRLSIFICAFFMSCFHILFIGLNSLQVLGVRLILWVLLLIPYLFEFEDIFVII